MPDGWEVNHELNPLLDDSGEDFDEDDLTNFEEYQYLTLPNNNDTDSDLMPDGWEVANNHNPLKFDNWKLLIGTYIVPSGIALILVSVGFYFLTPKVIARAQNIILKRKREAEFLVESGKSLLESKQFSIALEYFEEALKLIPRHTEARQLKLETIAKIKEKP